MSARPSLAGHGSERLAVRRRQKRKRTFVAIGVVLIILIVSVFVGVRQSAVRINHIDVYGGDASIAAIASSTMQGYYLGLIPRDSIFFFPESQIRLAVIKVHPGVAAISFFRNGFKGLSIKINERVAIGTWCGLQPTEGVDPYCYVFDSSGFVFAAAASSTETINHFLLYDPLEGNTEEPLGATLAHTDALPHTFDFARQLGTFGSPVAYIVIKDDEVSQYMKSGTRVTYVIGNEENAYTALVSSKENLNLADGSVEYVDLRFDGKVYLKKMEVPQ